jgi:hypothetical protein
MSGQVKRPSLRARLLSFLGSRPADLALRRASDLTARGLLREGTRMWTSDPRLVQEAIDKVERAWALSRDPMIAVQLATMYDRTNQNQDALVVLREAFRNDPHHALVRHHAAITLLRHGAPDAIRDFIESVLKLEPGDAFAQFVAKLLDRFDAWTEQLVASIARMRDGRQPFVISLPVWGQLYSDYFVRYLCATLLSPNNLPALAKSHSIHLALFTTEETERDLRADAMFRRLEEHATVEFVHYGNLVDYKAAMEACYEHQQVPYSNHSLAFYYARTCKFALMSCAHYVALAAGRTTDALVSCQVADLILNDGALPLMAERLASEADAVLIHAIQMPGKILRPKLEQSFRRADGVLPLSSQDCIGFIVEHMPEPNFVDSKRLLDLPLRISWRVGNRGILIHGNHYHPICLRPKAFTHPLRLTVDPVDSRFIDRTSLEIARIHLIQDASIVGMAVDDDPILEESENSMGALSVPLFALWLWGYWGRLRGVFFRSPLRLGSATSGQEWQRAEEAASAIVDAIVDRTAELEASQQAAKSWRLPTGAK